jgi:hypothetical protein
VIGRAVLAAFRRVKPVSNMGAQVATARHAQDRDPLQLGA